MANSSAETDVPPDRAGRLMVVGHALSGAKDPLAELPVLDSVDTPGSHEGWRSPVFGLAQVEV